MNNQLDHKQKIYVSRDIITEVIGECGRWQVKTILFVYICKIPYSWFMASILFNARAPSPGDFICLATNVSNQCEYFDTNTNQTLTCNSFKFLPDIEYHTIVERFNLVCGRNIMIAISQMCHLLGILTGAIMATKMMRYFRPKHIFISGIFVQTFCGTVTGQTWDFIIHCIFRSLSATGGAIMMTSGLRIFTEITDGIYKFYAIVLYDTGWAIGEIMLPFIAEHFKIYTDLYIAIMTPNILLIILYFFIPDAPRWLLRHDKLEAARQVLIEGAIKNNRQDKIPSTFVQDLQKLQILLIAEKHENWKSLWKKPRTNAIVLHITSALYNICFFGMILNLSVLGMEYIKFTLVISGLEEILGYILAAVFIKKLPNAKWATGGILSIISSAIGFIGWLIPHNFPKYHRMLFFMAISGPLKICISLSRSMIIACAGDLFPISKRQIAAFSVATIGQIILVGAPFISVLDKINTDLPIAVFSVMAFIAGSGQFSLAYHLIDEETQLIHRESILILRRAKQLEKQQKKDRISVNKLIKNT